MSDTGSSGTTGGDEPYDPYDPNRPATPPPPPPPAAPGWGARPPPPAPDQPAYGQQPPGQPPVYGQPQYGQQPFGQQPFGQSAYGAPVGSPPPNYLVPAILATVFCCLPLGIVSIVFAAQVNGKHAAGDLAGAQESSRKAKQFAIWSAATGVVVAVLYILGIVALAANS